MFVDNFCRYEFKFPVTYDTMNEMLKDFEPYVIMDSYGENGWYTISSIYFDNNMKQCYYETMNGDLFRQKVRLRVYGEINDSSAISFFELKMKIKGMVIKRRVSMKLCDALEFTKKCQENIDFNVEDYPSTNPQILSELKHVIQTKHLAPANVVSYDRCAMIVKDDPDVRITFDTKIRTRATDIDLRSGSYGQNVIDENKVVLELKSSKNLPVWLIKIIEKYNYRNLMFSKYCEHYNYKRRDAENAG